MSPDKPEKRETEIILDDVSDEDKRLYQSLDREQMAVSDVKLKEIDALSKKINTQRKMYHDKREKEKALNRKRNKQQRKSRKVNRKK